jgi:hypothetical protein
MASRARWSLLGPDSRPRATAASRSTRHSAGRLRSYCNSCVARASASSPRTTASTRLRASSLQARSRTEAPLLRKAGGAAGLGRMPAVWPEQVSALPKCRTGATRAGASQWIAVTSATFSEQRGEPAHPGRTALAERCSAIIAGARGTARTHRPEPARGSTAIPAVTRPTQACTVEQSVVRSDQDAGRCRCGAIWVGVACSEWLRRLLRRAPSTGWRCSSLRRFCCVT